MKAKAQFAAGAVALALALPAIAAMPSALPRPRTENGITYLSGGIGETEAAAMKREARHYPLSMVFSADKDNEFLADIRVTIKDEAGKELLSAVSDGPILLVKLPAGKYEVDADRKGRTLHRSVSVPTKGERQLDFHWPRA